jgi:hypothetical protein
MVAVVETPGRVEGEVAAWVAGAVPGVAGAVAGAGVFCCDQRTPLTAMERRAATMLERRANVCMRTPSRGHDENG